MNIMINALFNKHTRDSKKESMTFYIKGSAETMPELQGLHRSVVTLRITGMDASVTGEFKKLNRDDKKTTIEFEIKGGTSLEDSGKFFAKSGTDVELCIESAGQDVEDFRKAQKEYHKGLKGKINGDGTVDLDKNQTTLDEFVEDEDEESDPMHDQEEDLPFSDPDPDADDLE